MAENKSNLKENPNELKISENSQVANVAGDVTDHSKIVEVQSSESVTDAWPFGKPKETNISTVDGRPIGSPSTGIASVSVQHDAEYYKMNHQKRGVAIILNHINFDAKTGMGKRNGSAKDAERVQNCLKKLGFEVRVFTDLVYQDVNAQLEKISKEDHSNSDCFIMVVMSHGERGILFAKNHQYPVDEIWNPFTGSNCPSLAGKPKLFFLQACRGSKLDAGIALNSRSATQVDAAPSNYSYTIPAMADILVMYSTFEGYYAWRSPDKGSWFIQSLCAEFEQNAENRDLLTMLTFVCRRVAVGYESNVPNNKDMDQMKQIPSIVSMLTRLVFLGTNRK